MRKNNFQCLNCGHRNNITQTCCASCLEPNPEFTTCMCLKDGRCVMTKEKCEPGGACDDRCRTFCAGEST